MISHSRPFYFLLGDKSGFPPIVAGLDAVSECYLFSIHCAGFQDLDIQIATIKTKKSLSLEQGRETIRYEHLEDQSIFVPVVTLILVHVERTAFGTFYLLHVNLLSTT